MKTLNRPLESLAGNLALFLIPVQNIATLIDQTITVTDVEMVLQVICSRETINHLSTATKTAAGSKYTHKVTASAYGWSNANDMLLDQFMKYKLFVIIRDSEGNYLSIGSRDLGLTLTWEYDSGADASAKKGYSITLAGDLTTNTRLLEFETNTDGSPVVEEFAPIVD